MTAQHQRMKTLYVVLGPSGRWFGDQGYVDSFMDAKRRTFLGAVKFAQEYDYARVFRVYRDARMQCGWSFELICKFDINKGGWTK